MVPVVAIFLHCLFRLWVSAALRHSPAMALVIQAPRFRHRLIGWLRRCHPGKLTGWPPPWVGLGLSYRPICRKRF